MKHYPLHKSAICLAVLASLTAFNAQSEQQVANTPDAEKEIEVIKVTSRKREESIIEVPMSVSSVSAVEIGNRNLLNKDDLYRTLAGAANPRGELILRGLSGGNSSAPGTTSAFTDDIPYDFGDLYDIEAVEVLRGPQGTLWGSNAIGGTSRIITKKPQLDELEIATSVQSQQTKNVDGNDTRVWGTLNIPLIEDTLAMRVTGHSATIPGAIVNTKTGVQRERRNDYIRGQFLYKVDEDIQMNLGIWSNNRSSIGTISSDLSKPGFYRVANVTPNADSPWGYDVDYSRVTCAATASRSECRGGNKTGKTDAKYTIWEALDSTLDTSTDLVTLQSSHDNFMDMAVLSYSGSFREFKSSGLDNWTRLDMDDMVETWILNDDASKRTTHELRLQSKDEGALKWTVGAFYDKSRRGYLPNYQWQYHQKDPASIAIFSDWSGMFDESWEALGIHNVGELGQKLFGDSGKNYSNVIKSSFDRELAYFGEMSYGIDTADMGRFEVTAGIRFYDLEDSLNQMESGIWIGADASENKSSGSESGNRKKLSVSWLPEQNYSVYALYAEGYRPGGNNGPLANACRNDEFASGRKDRYTSDTVENYEVGFKGNVNNRFQFASAVYQIDWDDVIVDVYMPSCGFTYTGNAAKARSKGVEFESKLNVTDSLDMVFNASYTDAKLLNDVASLQAKAGQNMTMVPKYNAYLGLDQSFTLYNRASSVRLDVEAYGEYKSHFNARADGFDTSEAYRRVNLSGKMDLNDNVKLSVFVKNLFNAEIEDYKRARSRGTNTRNFLTVDYAPERSVALRVDYTFF